ncbi:MAG: hypothetical protein AMS21_07590 [Gemmatimonas sp. SG8_38_2]|nr:MAG: hypothetical protein AMS21_07590 [Gemmatimonas sp. SG8_38_2]
MEIGFGFWVLFFVIFFGCGKMCGWGVKKYKHRHHELDDRAVDDSDRRLSDLESRVKKLGDRGRSRDFLMEPMAHGDGAEKAAVPRSKKRSSALEDLQKRFVEGSLSMAEYEQELDRLEKIE